ncbi:hypothetical protein ACFGVR_12830 [Mucilaginibacter sp. AW1-3]
MNHITAAPVTAHLDTLIEKLVSYSNDILAPGDFHERLAPAIKNYSELLFSLTGLSLDGTSVRANIYTDHGKAIGPLWAAFCVNEILRTQRFCRGLYKAVADKLQQNDTRPVHVVYAGTGPFATLALPVIMQFKASQLQFTLLEINPESYDTLTNLLKTLHLEEYIKSIELCDAITWKAPHDEVDIVLSETMNRALIKEPQINIMLNMASQLPDTVTYIPQEISVGLAIKSPGALTHLTGLYSFNRAGYQKIINRSAGQSHWIFDTKTVNYQPTENGRLMYTTDITVYGDEKLGHEECSLNIPLKVKPEMPVHAAVLEFTYHDGQTPGFVYSVIE